MSADQPGQTPAAGEPDPALWRHKRKVRAFLAVGLILGLGGVATLAAYTSSVFGEATFQTGTFNTQGKFRDGAWKDFDKVGTPPVGNFAFELNPLQMMPGDTVYAPVAIRVDSTSSYDADVTLVGATSTIPTSPLFLALTYSVTNAAPADCQAPGSGEAYQGWPTNFPLDQGSTEPVTVRKEDGENGLDFCFALTLPSDFTVQGAESGTLEWEFASTSIS